MKVDTDSKITWVNPEDLPSDKKRFTILGGRENLRVGLGFDITRPPWPFFDVKGGGIEIEDYVTISAGVYILTHTHRFEKENWRELEEVVPKEPTIISNYVFIGINAIILPSCKHIGEHSVVGAGSVVTKNIPDREIWAGNPAKKIRDVC